jgi:hypothetical protein
MKTVTRKSVEGSRPATARRARGSSVVTWDRIRELFVRYRFALITALAVAVVTFGQLVEDQADSLPGRMLSVDLATRRWTVIALVLYVFVISGVVNRTVKGSLAILKPVLKIGDAAHRAYELSVRRLDARIDTALLVASGVIVTLLFPVLGVELPLSNDLQSSEPVYLPAAPLSALVVLAGYTVVGWAGLRLVLGAMRLGRVLGRLSREPFDINVFDTTPLVPFGNIALAISLAPAGIIIILLIGIGPPGGFLGWTVLLLATLASLLALLLPLRGIHRQMYEAKDVALATLNARISGLYDEISSAPYIPAAEVARYRDTAGALIPLRKTAEEMTTWPFRDTVAFGRAVLIASAPLIYTTLSELIRVFVIGPLSSTRP